MTTRIAQASIAAQTSNTASPRVAQSGYGFMIRTFSLSSPTRVAQSGIGFMIRNFPNNPFLEVKPAAQAQVNVRMMDPF